MSTCISCIDYRERKGDLSVMLHMWPSCGQYCAGALRLRVAETGSGGSDPSTLLFASPSFTAGKREADVTFELDGCRMCNT